MRCTNGLNLAPGLVKNNTGLQERKDPTTFPVGRGKWNGRRRLSREKRTPADGGGFDEPSVRSNVTDSTRTRQTSLSCHMKKKEAVKKGKSRANVSLEHVRAGKKRRGGGGCISATAEN